MTGHSGHMTKAYQLTCKTVLETPGQHVEEADEVEEKKLVVLEPNTGIYPGTVVVKLGHTLVASRAVLGTKGTAHLQEERMEGGMEGGKERGRGEEKGRGEEEERGRKERKDKGRERGHEERREVGEEMSDGGGERKREGEGEQMQRSAQ